MNRFIAIVLTTLVALAGLSIVFGTWYRVDEGTRAVVLRNGVPLRVAEPGLGFKLPLIDRIETVSLRTRLETFADMQVYSCDPRPAVMRLSVNLRAVPDRVAALQAEYGSLEGAVGSVVRPRVEHEARAVFAGTSALAAIRDRRRLAARIEEAVRRAMPEPIRIESVQIENLVFARELDEAAERGSPGRAADCGTGPVASGEGVR